MYAPRTGRPVIGHDADVTRLQQDAVRDQVAITVGADRDRDEHEAKRHEQQCGELDVAPVIGMRHRRGVDDWWA